jgi:hypothetical protein
MTAPTMPALPTRQLRSAPLPDLAEALQLQRRQTVDMVIPASSIVTRDGNLLLASAPAIITDDGVLDPSGAYVPTPNADSQLAGIFGIPVKYIRTLRERHVELYDTNINEWATHDDFADKKVLVRTLWGSTEGSDTVGILRAVLSDRYGARDNFDTLVAVLDGIRTAGLAADDLKIQGDLTDNNMFLTVNAPEIKGYGYKLLEGYRSPYANGHGTGHGGSDAENLPIISAGLVIRNSETGAGALSITPRLVVRACSNGLQVTKDAMRQVHLGSKLAEGAIVWSDETRLAANDLAKKQAADAVASFLNASYVQSVIDELERDADVPVVDVPATIEVVAKEQAYTETEAKGVLDFFIRGGQLTAGGVMQAVTAYVQQVESPERAYDLEAGAIDAMKVAAKANALV